MEKPHIKNFYGAIVVAVLLLLHPSDCSYGNRAHRELHEQVLQTMRKAATFFYTKVASHGGYVYYYTVDLKQRWGEGMATRDQIWVQPPGTPTVGMAYLKAFEATGDRFYLDAAKKAAEALVYGQLHSGGWTNCIDFDPRGQRVAQYRNGRGRGKNNSSLDDGQTQSAIRLLVRVDKALSFQHKDIHKSVSFALNALLAAQFPNGGFPQVWTGPVAKHPIIKAGYPTYDWRTEGRIKNYWDLYTLNDNVAGYVTQALIDAYQIYKDERYMTALHRLGDFLILAQMPDPQPAWAQQYNYDMEPVWARKFEPPGIAGGESQEAIETLMEIYRVTNDCKYLGPVPRALAYLKRSLLPDGKLARFYELETNKPLYMFRRGDIYTLTYDDSNLPGHYGWKTESRLDDIERQYNDLKGPSRLINSSRSPEELENQVRQIITSLDNQGRWISIYQGEPLVGQPKFKHNTPYIASAVFSRNIEMLGEYLNCVAKQMKLIGSIGKNENCKDRNLDLSVGFVRVRRGEKAVFGAHIPWFRALDAPGAGQMTHLKRLMESLPFLSRVPDQLIIVGDPGEGIDHAQATRDANGAYAKVYLPTGKPVTVNLDKLQADKVRVSWFDPRRGTTESVGEFPTHGTQTFVPPTSGPGYDWILVLRNPDLTIGADNESSQSISNLRDVPVSYVTSGQWRFAATWHCR